MNIHLAERLQESQISYALISGYSRDESELLNFNFETENDIK